MINLDELKRILELARDHELSEFEVESDGFKVRLRKGGPVLLPSAPAAVAYAPPPAAPAAPQAPPPAAATPDVDVDVELAIVTSPIVGTFYRAPEPSAPPFVSPGDRVKKGQTLCIIEAMKMMNNIDSEYEGTVVKVFAENGQPVQYGERLFAIKR
jgi:acetyl-CoA carboxylase biotin carboxyl carrier protein